MSLAMALLVGLLQGSLHCAGMCGPFVLSYGLALAPGRASGARGGAVLLRREVVVPLLAQNAGRLSAFTLLGALFGVLGSFVNAAARVTGLQAAAGVVGGLAMLVWAADHVRTGHGGAGLEKWSLWRIPGIGTRLRALLARRDPLGAYGFGFMLGIHPCGLLYAMLLAAAATGSAVAGGGVLLAFGLGTVPALLALAGIGAAGAARFRGRGFVYASAGVVAASGLLFALRGMAVNGWVPHVWPWLF